METYFLSMNPSGFFSPNLVNIDNQLTIGSLLAVCEATCSIHC